MKNFKLISRRINAFACDLAFAYALFYLLMFIRPIGFPVIACYCCSVVLYFCITYWIFRGSLMQNLFGIVIEKHPLRHALFKILFVGIIPFCLSFFLYELFLFFFLFWYLVIVFLAGILLLLFTKRSLWQWCSGSQMKRQNDFKKNKTLILISLLAIFSLIFFQWLRQTDKNIASPVSLPEKAYYLKNIEQYKQAPVDYVMQLFDNYDIVILCERWHPECTQWEFFSEIILNDTFAKKVKHVFMEFGQIQNQKILDSYMQTHFSSKEELQRATAQIVRENGGVWPIWNNTNIYDFILNLHQYNETKEDTDRIKLFFSDMQINWDAIKNPAQWDSITHTNRDSIMAYNVLNQYDKLADKKCLLITNTRHAWNYRENEAAYICEKFPGKTAIVWINGTTQVMLPPMNGALDKAALEITDSIWAIDFQKCPLGKTQFDLMPNKRDKCTYKDLFVGMIYCGHPSNWEIGENYPFILDNYKDTLLRKSAMVGKDYLKMTTNAINSGYYNEIDKRTPSPFRLYNFAFGVLHTGILLYLLLNLLGLLCKKQKESKATTSKFR